MSGYKKKRYLEKWKMAGEKTSGSLKGEAASCPVSPNHRSERIKKRQDYLQRDLHGSFRKEESKGLQPLIRRSQLLNPFNDATSNNRRAVGIRTMCRFNWSARDTSLVVLNASLTRWVHPWSVGRSSSQ